MSAKADAPAAPAAPAAAAPAKKGGAGGFLPLVIALVAAPAATWATVEFLLLPRLKAQLSAPAVAGAEGEHAEAAEESGGHGEGKEGEKGAGGASYEFANVVVNLAGTMGTRYLKCSFLVTGTNPNIKGIFEENKPRLMDVTLNVMSALTLADLEEPGSKNIIREKLVTAYNTALGKKIADQVYFSDFVVQ